MIQHWTSVLLAGVVALSTSCSTDENEPQPTPVFPEAATLNIPAGETTCEVSFTPNLDWTVSIPTDAETARWFKLRDGEITTTSISGKASTSPVTITVETSDQTSFDLAPVCEVSLTMGGETRVIAKITRLTTAREFDLFASDYSASDDDFIIPYTYSGSALAKYTGSETSLALEDAPEGAVELKWPVRVGGFMYVFKSTSNFNWLASTPEWLSVTSTPVEGEDGAYQITVNGEFTEENIDGAVGVIDFYDASLDDKTQDPGNNAHNKYCVTMPAFRDIIRSNDFGTTYSFNADGNYVDMNGTVIEDYDCTGEISSIAGVKFYVAVSDGTYYYASPEMTGWVTVTDSWDENGGVFQTHTYTIQVTPNATPRTATLLVLPKSMADQISNPDTDLFDNTGKDFKEEYKPYILATIEQAGGESGGDSGFSISSGSGNNMYEMLNYFKFEDLTNVDPNTDEDVAANAGEIEMGAKLYRLTYNNSSMSEGSLQLDIAGEYSMVMTMPYGNNWLVFYDVTSGMVDDGKCVIGMSGEDRAQGATGDKGSIVFYGSDGNIAARIICIRNY